LLFLLSFQILLSFGAGINTHSNEFKESALTLACYKGHLEMVRFLLEAGADQEHKTDEMHTALMEASMDGHVEVARLLLDSGKLFFIYLVVRGILNISNSLQVPK
jgi:ankyrin repeat domain-containing protein 17